MKVDKFVFYLLKFRLWLQLYTNSSRIVEVSLFGEVCTFSDKIA